MDRPRSKKIPSRIAVKKRSRSNRIEGERKSYTFVGGLQKSLPKKEPRLTPFEKELLDDDLREIRPRTNRAKNQHARRRIYRSIFIRALWGPEGGIISLREKAVGEKNRVAKIRS